MREYLSSRPRIIITFHADLAVAPAFLHHLRRDTTLAYYVEMTFDTWTPRHAVKEVAKHALFRAADAFFAPGPDGDAYVRRYAGPDARIFRLRHAIDVAHFANAIGARARRRSDEPRTPFTFLYVGRLWWQKGVGTLLESARILEEQGCDFRLLLVGDGSDREWYAATVEGLSLRSVSVLPFRQTETLSEVYALADAFVFPTRGDPYGLVVDEAMAAGLPVIATTAAGEIHERVVPDINGTLVPPDDTGVLVDAMRGYVADPKRAQCMGAEASKHAGTRTVDAWAESVERAVTSLLGDP